MSDDQSAQEDEILVLKSIYEGDDLFDYDEEKKSGKFYVKFENPDFNVHFVNEKLSVKVEHLPPLEIDFEFPHNYPSTQPVKFHLSSRWLSLNNLSKLCKKLDDLWTQNENTSILFTWISFLSDELFDFLHLKVDDLKVSNDEKKPSGDLDARCQKLACSSRLIKDYDKDQSEQKFQNGYFTCNVCFTDKPGKECMKFHKCEHVFCNECMKGYFETQIKEGNVKNLTCPNDKCDTQALQTQVLNLVDADLFHRYDSLLLKDSLNNMLDIVYCPRVSCQCPVIPEETLAQCPECNYSFCALCRQGYHGIEPCKITNSQMKEICNAYKSGDEFTKSDLIKRYGEKRILAAVEECTSMELIENTSKRCPSCKSWMQKLDGCNKMTCARCLCYFCWLCGKSLSKSDPYSHFSNQSSECFERLFEGIENVQSDNEENFGSDDEDNNDE